MMDKATAEAKARELLSTKVTPLIGEWECSLRPDQISRFVPLIAAALEESGACPHCDEQFRELLERRESEIERLTKTLEEAGADTRRLDCIIGLLQESDDGTLPFFPVGRSTIDSYVAYRKIITAAPTPADSAGEGSKGGD
jgi:hypothetical protein